MYADPRLIKKHEVKLKLDDFLNKDLDLMVEFTGEQKAVLAREFFMIGLEAVKKERQSNRAA